MDGRIQYGYDLGHSLEGVLVNVVNLVRKIIGRALGFALFVAMIAGAGYVFVISLVAGQIWAWLVLACVIGIQFKK